MGDKEQRCVTIRFYEELNDFILPERRKVDFIHHISKGQTVKDLIESLGVPHTEVDLILVNSETVGFEYQLQHQDLVSVYPLFERLDISKVNCLRPEPLREIKFVLDVHLAKLARYLRMLGFDTLHEKDYGDAEIAEISQRESRIVLTRDRGLLKRRIITHGRYVRNVEPHKQLKEVVNWLDLFHAIKPFSRCIRCNGLLEQVDKSAVKSLLAPETDRYYQQFWQCSECGNIYWQGSHYQKMEKVVAEIIDGQYGEC